MIRIQDIIINLIEKLARRDNISIINGGSLNIKDKAMSLTWTKRIALSENGVARIREIAGVYRLVCFKSNTGKFHAYYVGQAENLRERLRQHLAENEENSCCKKYLANYDCYFRAAAVANQSDRDTAESALYHHFKPSCVERVPDVSPADINFE